jgi:hypothetical protein
MTCLLDFGSELLVDAFNLTHVCKVGRFIFAYVLTIISKRRLYHGNQKYQKAGKTREVRARTARLVRFPDKYFQEDTGV